MFLFNNLLGKVNILSIYAEDYNTVFKNNPSSNFLFNQLSLLSETVASVTALQQFKGTIMKNQDILSAIFIEGLIKENLFSLSLLIVAVGFFSWMYANDSQIISSLIARLVQLLLYSLTLVVLQILISYDLLSSLFFELCLLGILLFLVLLMTSTSLNNIKSVELPVLIYVAACFGWVLLNVSDFALFIICIEGFSLTLYILATIARTYGGVVASIKYFAFGTLGSLMLY